MDIGYISGRKEVVREGGKGRRKKLGRWKGWTVLTMAALDITPHNSHFSMTGVKYKAKTR